MSDYWEGNSDYAFDVELKTQMKGNKMSKNFKKNPKYNPFGAMMVKREKDDNGDANYWIKIDKDVVVTVDGVEVTALNVQRPLNKLEFLLSQGHISKEQYEERSEQYQEGGKLEFITFELTADLTKK